MGNCWMIYYSLLGLLSKIYTLLLFFIQILQICDQISGKLCMSNNKTTVLLGCSALAILSLSFA